MTLFCSGKKKGRSQKDRSWQAFGFSLIRKLCSTIWIFGKTHSAGLRSRFSETKSTILLNKSVDFVSDYLLLYQNYETTQ
jgi:hypothetical protein